MLHVYALIDLFHRPCLCYQFCYIAINKAELVCTVVIMNHNYMLMCNHKIVINIILCLLKSTGHIEVEIYYSRPLDL